jgi:hypothetical protein
MCRKLVLLILVLCMAPTSYGVVIGNWETTASDGWTITGSPTFTPHVTPGHTLGDYAASIKPASGSYAWVLVGATYNAGSLYTAADWMANNTLTFDVTRLTSEWTATSNQYSRMHVAMTTNLVGQTTITPSAGVVYWTGLNSNVMTATVDYSAYKAAQSGTPSWIKIILGTQASGWSTMGNYYIDNVRLTPEPATMALFGLGGLALLRRRRT